jgi:hypothetical protein
MACGVRRPSAALEQRGVGEKAGEGREGGGEFAVLRESGRGLPQSKDLSPYGVQRPSAALEERSERGRASGARKEAGLRSYGKAAGGCRAPNGMLSH